eukprot:10203843-Ditylum_brightwellii.AAC.1
MRNEWDDILGLETVAYFYDEVTGKSLLGGDNKSTRIAVKNFFGDGGVLHSAGCTIHGGSSNAITHNVTFKMEHLKNILQIVHSAVEELLCCCTFPPSSHSNKYRKGGDIKRMKQIDMVVL